MALQATFRNAKAYSLQNGNAEKRGMVKVKLGRNNKIIIRILYNQDLINKIKIIPGENGIQRENIGKFHIRKI